MDELWHNWGCLPQDTQVCQTCVYWEGERHREGENVYCLGQTDGVCNNFDWAGYQQLMKWPIPRLMDTINEW